MGNQRKHRQKTRKTKEAIRNGATPQVGWQEKLAEAVKNGKVALVPNAPATTSVLTPAPVLLAPVETKKEPTTAPAKMVAKPQPSVVHRAVWQIYRDYFRGCLDVYQYNELLGLQCDLKGALEGKSLGRYPLPAGFIPGPLVTVGFRALNGETEYQIVYATPEVVAEYGIEFPTPWKSLKGMPSWLGQTVGTHLALIESIGGEPTPWDMGVVRTFRKERISPGTLHLGFSQFQYSGYEAKPFGCCLVPELGTGGLKGFRLTKVYNPGRLPGVPIEGTLLNPEFLNCQGPVQKILNTWSGMIDNFFHYSESPDKPKPYRKPEPNQRR